MDVLEDDALTLELVDMGLDLLVSGGLGVRARDAPAVGARRVRGHGAGVGAQGEILWDIDRSAPTHRRKSTGPAATAVGGAVVGAALGAAWVKSRRLDAEDEGEE